MSVVATPILGTITDEHTAQCTCGRAIVLVVFNWKHTDDGLPMCRRAGDSGAVQQESKQ